MVLNPKSGTHTTGWATSASTPSPWVFCRGAIAGYKNMYNGMMALPVSKLQQRQGCPLGYASTDGALRLPTVAAPVGEGPLGDIPGAVHQLLLREELLLACRTVVGRLQGSHRAEGLQQAQVAPSGCWQIRHHVRAFMCVFNDSSSITGYNLREGSHVDISVGQEPSPNQ